ncbi:hypothetical protein AMECASPLE_038353 [Ameca splendens]|uniref:Uncharacterized protein n=1 Tax=Ameca splendens TaxID=208324 RepID=A0ABV0YV80_9TELE
MARLRLQAPVRRPNSQNTEPRNLLRIHDSLQLKYTDGESRMGSGEDTKLEEEGVISRRSRDYRDSYHHFISHRSALQDGIHVFFYFVSSSVFSSEQKRGLTSSENQCSGSQ